MILFKEQADKNAVYAASINLIRKSQTDWALPWKNNIAVESFAWSPLVPDVWDGYVGYVGSPLKNVWEQTILIFWYIHQNGSMRLCTDNLTLENCC
jgi:hypothetical protein